MVNLLIPRRGRGGQKIIVFGTNFGGIDVSLENSLSSGRGRG